MKGGSGSMREGKGRVTVEAIKWGKMSDNAILCSKQCVESLLGTLLATSRFGVSNREKCTNSTVI